MTKTFDAFECIPSAEAVRRRLTAVREEVRRLHILLTTAEQIERERAGDSSSNDGGNHAIA